MKPVTSLLTLINMTGDFFSRGCHPQLSTGGLKCLLEVPIEQLPNVFVNSENGFWRVPEAPPFGDGAMGSWRLKEGGSFFFGGMTAAKLPMTQWMVHTGLH